MAVLINEYEPLTYPLLQTIGHHLDNVQAGKFLNAWYTADMIERTERPYAIFVPVGEKQTSATNRTRYVVISLEIEIAGDSLKELSGIAGKFRTWIENTPMPFDHVPEWANVSLDRLMFDELIYGKDGDEWFGTLKYEAKMSQKLTQTPTR